MSSINVTRSETVYTLRMTEREAQELQAILGAVFGMESNLEEVLDRGLAEAKAGDNPFMSYKDNDDDHAVREVSL